MGKRRRKLAITICATTGYTYAMRAQARAIQQNLFGLDFSVEVILVTDENRNSDSDIPEIAELYRELFPCSLHVLNLPVKPSPQKDYKVQNSLTIAQMRTAAFSKARALNVDFVWSLDSDVIPNPNNLRCMANMLAFDNGYYDVAFVPYVSAGGGGYMGGRGTTTSHILPNFYENEVTIPDELKAKEEELREELKKEQTPELIAQAREVNRKIRECPPKGNVFEANAKGWRRRGWLENAYPAIGKGATLESDWMPFGNNLFSRRAIHLVDFTAYLGLGTEDLHCGWQRLKPEGLRFCVIPHCVSHHVRRKKDEQGNEKLTVLYMYHEAEGECIGHLRHREIPFYSHEAGEIGI